jgi:hypothetical protein
LVPSLIDGELFMSIGCQHEAHTLPPTLTAASTVGKFDPAETNGLRVNHNPVAIRQRKTPFFAGVELNPGRLRKTFCVQGTDSLSNEP